MVWSQVFMRKRVSGTDSLLRVENEHALKEINSYVGLERGFGMSIKDCRAHTVRVGISELLPQWVTLSLR
jgi:hypothetical protein